MGPGPRLPPELTDQVITLLQDDHSALDQCALVCKDWYNRSRYCRYREVVVSGVGTYWAGLHENIDHFTWLVQHSSRIAHQVQSLRIRNTRSDNFSGLLISELNLYRLQRLVPSLPNLSRLYITRAHLTYLTPSIPDGASLKDQTPITLILDTIQGIEWLTHFLVMFADIASLHCVGLWKMTSESPKDIRSKIKVRSLHLSPIGENIGIRETLLTSVIKLDELSRLVCEIRSMKDLPGTNLFFSRLSQHSIHTLELDLRWCNHDGML